MPRFLSVPWRFGTKHLEGARLGVTDIGLTRNFSAAALSETARVWFRFEAFNILNRTNFGLPATEFSGHEGGWTQLLGRITETASTERQIQFALIASR